MSRPQREDEIKEIGEKLKNIDDRCSRTGLSCTGFRRATNTQFWLKLIPAAIVSFYDICSSSIYYSKTRFHLKIRSSKTKLDNGNEIQHQVRVHRVIGFRVLAKDFSLGIFDVAKPSRVYNCLEPCIIRIR